MQAHARTALVAVVAAVLSATPAAAADADWNAVLEAARGQTVYWNAWGGKPEINDYMAWAADAVEERHGVTVEIVKLRATADAVQRILAEKQAGRTQDGSVDLLWVNGANFAAMVDAGLLAEPWTHRLPNYELVDLTIPSNTVDFGTPVDNREAPYGFFQLNFPYSPARMPDPPADAAELLAYAEANPGRITYPNPSNFLGHTFLKQILHEVTPDPAVLQQPAGAVDFTAATAPLWAYLDRLHPHLWREGRDFPADETVLRRMLADGAVDMSVSFGPGETSAAIDMGLVPPETRTFVFEGGTIGNTSFNAIPFNAGSKEGAMVLANFLLSPEAQARKQDPRVWGAFTVLDLDALSADERAPFEALPDGVATLSRDELGTPLPEPHFTWTVALQEAWAERYRR